MYNTNKYKCDELKENLTTIVFLYFRSAFVPIPSTAQFLWGLDIEYISSFCVEYKLKIRLAGFVTLTTHSSVGIKSF